jgi:hypothetical protein
MRIDGTIRLTACMALTAWSHRYCQCEGFVPAAKEKKS